MPQMGDSVTEGTVLEWHKQEGDTRRGRRDPRRDLDRQGRRRGPAAGPGTVVKIHAAEGDTVAVGSVLPRSRRRNGAGRRAPSGRRAEPPTAGRSRRAGRRHRRCPPMGESVTEGTILEWAKQPGDPVDADETIVEISTDKVDAEVPAPAAGTLTEILAEAGDTVTVGQVHRAHDVRATAQPPPRRAAPRRRHGAPAPATPRPAATPDGVKVTPVAAPRRRRRTGVDLGSVARHRPGGRITKADVLAFKGNGAAATAPAAADARAAPTLLKGGAAMLARYMDESRSIPTATSFRTLTVTALDARRKQLKDAGQKVSFTHLIAYAIARAATEQMPVMAAPLRRARRQAAPRRRRRRQPRPRRRRREEGRLAHADGAGDPRRRPARLRRSSSPPTTTLDRQGARRTSSPPTTCRARTSRSPTRAASARSPRCRG